jgi:hypothetical protein
MYKNTIMSLNTSKIKKKKKKKKNILSHGDSWLDRGVFGHWDAGCGSPCIDFQAVGSFHRDLWLDCGFLAMETYNQNVSFLFQCFYFFYLTQGYNKDFGSHVSYMMYFC